MNEVYEINGSLFYKQRQCPICDKDLYIDGIGVDFFHLKCKEHQNVNLYIVGENDDT